MLPYSRQLKQNARELRSHMTDAEQKLWYRLRRKQVNGWQFYRQKPIGQYIVDFYSPEAGLVVELDGSQHFEPEHQAADQKRDAHLAGLGLRVLRFDNRQVLLEMDAVMGVIAKSQIPPSPPFSKWGENQRTDEGAAFEQKLPAPVTPCEKETTTLIPLFEKEATASIPPFEKGGLGGICVDSTMTVEKES